MDFKPGDIVTLKSGGQALTVASVDKTEVECVWLGEEGDLFRETLPAIVLMPLVLDEDGEDDHDDHEHEEEEDEEGDDEDSDERHVA